MGYSLEEFKLRDSELSPKRLSQILISRGIVGLLLPPIENPGNPLELDYEQFSTVTFGYSITPHLFHLVTNHQFHSMSLALEELAKLGYQRIGVFLHEYVDSKTDNAYTSSYWRFQQRHPEREHIPACIVPDGQSDREALVAWINAHQPDVILSDTDEPTTEMLAKLGLNVPKDIGCAWLSQSGENDARAGIDQKGQLIGQTAIDFLVGMLQRGERGIPETPIRMLVEGAWRPGKTVLPQRQRKPRHKKGRQS